ncbi:MAG: hypothetical protein II716_03320, partial [Treponema sp.]|nr:hypothetical protein [Treponema sp.]
LNNNFIDKYFGMTLFDRTTSLKNLISCKDAKAVITESYIGMGMSSGVSVSYTDTEYYGIQFEDNFVNVTDNTAKIAFIDHYYQNFYGYADCSFTLNKTSDTTGTIKVTINDLDNTVIKEFSSQMENFKTKHPADYSKIESAMKSALFMDGTVEIDFNQNTAEFSIE